MKKAFTLAEVMIALVIIGVVAAITVPAVKTQIEKQDTITGLKAAYSIVSQSVNRAWVDHGTITYWNLSLSDEEFGKTYVKPYFVYTKECTQMSDGCWETDGFNGYYDLAGNKKTNTVPYSLVLNNGMILGVNIVADGDFSVVSYIVDINGQKKPNKMGRDIFSFYIFNPDYNSLSAVSKYKNKGKEGLYIGGFANSGPPHAFYTRDELLGTSIYRACNKKASGGNNGNRPGIGAACAAVIAKDGWQIKNDYPW